MYSFVIVLSTKPFLLLGLFLDGIRLLGIERVNVSTWGIPQFSKKSLINIPVGKTIPATFLFPSTYKVIHLSFGFINLAKSAMDITVFFM